MSGRRLNRADFRAVLFGVLDASLPCFSKEGRRAAGGVAVARPAHPLTGGLGPGWVPLPTPKMAFLEKNLAGPAQRGPNPGEGGCSQAPYCRRVLGC